METLGLRKSLIRNSMDSEDSVPKVIYQEVEIMDTVNTESPALSNSSKSTDLYTPTSDLTKTSNTTITTTSMATTSRYNVESKINEEPNGRRHLSAKADVQVIDDNACMASLAAKNNTSMQVIDDDDDEHTRSSLNRDESSNSSSTYYTENISDVIGVHGKRKSISKTDNNINENCEENKVSQITSEEDNISCHSAKSSKSSALKLVLKKAQALQDARDTSKTLKMPKKRCCAKSCESSPRTDKSIRLFQLPSDVDRAKKWCEVLHIPFKTDYYVCEKHFKPGEIFGKRLSKFAIVEEKIAENIQEDLGKIENKTSIYKEQLKESISEANLDSTESTTDREVKKYFIVENQEEEKKIANITFDKNQVGDFDDTMDLETSISRTSTPKINKELLQLQNSVNESKILSEYMQDVNEKTLEKSTKSRRPRKIIPLKTDEDSSSKFLLQATRSRSRSYSNYKLEEDSSPERDRKSLQKWKSEERLNKRSRARAASTSSKIESTSRSGSVEKDYQPSNYSEKSFENWSPDQKLNKRAMRSQNSDFVQKHMKFLKSVNNTENNDSESDDEETSSQYTRNSSFTVSNKLSLIQSTWKPAKKSGSDSFCWKCHLCDDELVHCMQCPRSFHFKCSKSSKVDKGWICLECISLVNFNKQSSRAGKSILSQDHLNHLLQFALKQIKQAKNYEYFLDDTNFTDAPDYCKYIKYPFTLKTLQDNVTKRKYKSTEEFFIESKWIQHNTICYYGASNKLTSIAKSIVKICRQESTEIETCPECYLNANTREDWFVEVCTRPHILLWAKLKGFPYWPAKAMGIVTPSLVNVRFFGAHDRANVSVKECYLYSNEDPNPPTKQKNSSRSTIAECIKEVEVHIVKLRKKFGSFKIAPYKTFYDPTQEPQQLELMIPGIQSYLKSISNPKRPLTFKIIKSADNILSMVKKPDTDETAITNIESKLSSHTKPTNNQSSPSKIDLSKSIYKSTTNLSVKESLPSSIIKSVSADPILSKPKQISLIQHVSSEKSVTKDSIAEVKNNQPVLKLNPEAIKNAKETLNVAEKLNDKQIEKSTDDDEKKTNEKHEAKLQDKIINTNNMPDEQLVESYEVISPDKKTFLVDAKKLQLVLKRRYENTSSSSSSIDSGTTGDVKKIKNQDIIAEKNLQAIKDIKDNNSKVNIEETKKAVEHIHTYSNKRKRSTAIDENLINDAKKPSHMQTNIKTTNLNTTITNNGDSNVPILLMLNQNAAAQSAINTPTNSSPKLSYTMSSINSSGANTSLTSKVNTMVVKSITTKPSIVPLKATVSTPTSILTIAPNINKLMQTNKSVTITRMTKDNLQQYSTNSAATTTMAKITIKSKNMNIEKPNDKNQNMSLMQNKTVIPTQTRIVPTSLTEAATKDYINLQFHRPFIEHIKIEKPDEGIPAISQQNSFSSQINLRNQPKNPVIQSSETIPTNNNAPSSNQNNIIPTLLKETELEAKNVEIKTEISSDDEQILEKQLNNQQNLASTSSSTCVVNNNENSLNIQRITVRDISTLQNLQTATQTKAIENFIKATRKIEYQRAKKSFPNKIIVESPTIPLVTSLPSTTTDGKNSNRMVIIPMDQQKQQQQPQQIGTVPVPPLTAVSKTNSNVQHVQPPLNHVSVGIQNENSVGNNMNVTQRPDQNNLNNSNNSVTNSNPPSNSSGIMIANVTGASSSSNNTNNNNTNSNTSNNNNNSCNNNNSSEQLTPEHMLSDFVTPTLAAAITDAIVRPPPQLAQRPQGTMQSQGDYVFHSEAGPVSRTLMDNTHKMTDFFRSVIEDTIGDMASNGVLEAKLKLLELENEKLKTNHDKAMSELKNSTDLIISEMRNSMEKEKQRIISEIRKQCEIERIRAVEETKKKQWCAMCGKEAQFYCCWNCSYCDFPCQQKHWPKHMSNCGQNDATTTINASLPATGSSSLNNTRIQSKITQFTNVKDKTVTIVNNKSKELSNINIAPRLTSGAFIRPVTGGPNLSTLSMPQIRNQAPFQIQGFNLPLSIQAAQGPPYTIVSASNSGNYQPRFLTTNSGGIFIDTSNKGVTTMTTPSGIIRTVPMNKKTSKKRVTNV